MLGHACALQLEANSYFAETLFQCFRRLAFDPEYGSEFFSFYTGVLESNVRFPDPSKAVQGKRSKAFGHGLVGKVVVNLFDYVVSVKETGIPRDWKVGKRDIHLAGRVFRGERQDHLHPLHFFDVAGE